MMLLEYFNMVVTTAEVKMKHIGTFFDKMLKRFEVFKFYMLLPQVLIDVSQVQNEPLFVPLF